LAISLVLQPWLALVATVRKIAADRGESALQGISLGAVEADELGSLPFIDTSSGELPLGSELTSLPVDCPALGCAVEEAGEAAAVGVE
jgi:hypothetical protein